MFIPCLDTHSNRALPIGRFAPSPTGHLHLGSLITAVASYCIIKQQHGQWLVRIEDIDSDRCRPAYTEQILRDLARLGLHADQAIYYQSAHISRYHEALATLSAVTYACDCTRKSLESYRKAHQLSSSVYPQICYHRQLSDDHAVRVLMPDHVSIFFDQLQGVVTGNPQRDHGDMVLRRRASTPQTVGMINYMLAVVVDDAIQGVNQIVRGLDILPLTLPQLALIDYLKLPYPHRYYHLPILVNPDGQKLSKQTLAEPISGYDAQALLQLSLYLLGQPQVDNDTPERMLAQAVLQWDNAPLVGQRHIVCDSIGNMLKKLP